MPNSIYNMIHINDYVDLINGAAMEPSARNGYEQKVLININFRQSLPCEQSGNKTINHGIVTKILSRMYHHVHQIVDAEIADHDKSDTFAFIPSMTGYYSLNGTPTFASVTLGVPHDYNAYNFWLLVDSTLRQTPWVEQCSLIQTFENRFQELVWQDHLVDSAVEASYNNAEVPDYPYSSGDEANERL